MSWVEVTVAIVVIASALRGFKEGIILQMLSSLGLIVAFFLYIPVGNLIILHYMWLVDFRQVVMVFSLLTLFAPFYLAGLLLRKFLYSQGSEFSVPLKVAGGALGVFRGMIISVLLVGLVHQYTGLKAETALGRCMLKVYPATWEVYRKQAERFVEFF